LFFLKKVKTKNTNQNIFTFLIQEVPERSKENKVTITSNKIEKNTTEKANKNCITKHLSSLKGD